MKLDKDDIDAIADAVYQKIRSGMLIVGIVAFITVLVMRYFRL